jgi:hypothetical protein
MLYGVNISPKQYNTEAWTEAPGEVDEYLSQFDVPVCLLFTQTLHRNVQYI